MIPEYATLVRIMPNEKRGKSVSHHPEFRPITGEEREFSALALDDAQIKAINPIDNPSNKQYKVPVTLHAFTDNIEIIANIVVPIIPTPNKPIYRAGFWIAINNPPTAPKIVIAKKNKHFNAIPLYDATSYVPSSPYDLLILLNTILS